MIATTTNNQNGQPAAPFKFFKRNEALAGFVPVNNGKKIIDAVKVSSNANSYAIDWPSGPIWSMKIQIFFN